MFAVKCYSQVNGISALHIGRSSLFNTRRSFASAGVIKGQTALFDKFRGSLSWLNFAKKAPRGWGEFYPKDDNGDSKDNKGSAKDEEKSSEKKDKDEKPRKKADDEDEDEADGDEADGKKPRKGKAGELSKEPGKEPKKKDEGLEARARDEWRRRSGSGNSKQQGKKESEADGSDDDDGGGSRWWAWLDRPAVVWAVVGAVTAALTLLAWLRSPAASGGSEILWQTFQDELLVSGRVDHLEVVNGRVVLVHQEPGPEGRAPYYFYIGSVEAFELRLQQLQDALGVPPAARLAVRYTHTARAGPLVLEALAYANTALMVAWIALLVRRFRRLALDGPGKRKFAPAARPSTTFKQVAGLTEAKTEITEFVTFLKQPKAFTALGAKIPRGALLVGPPGCGKTLLAKACAGEAAVPFFSVSGADFVETFVGVGPQRVRDLFKRAKRSAPSIVFIDEIDAVGRARRRSGTPSNDERESTLNQLLIEMDGFDSQTNVVVFAGTNRADVLDPALLRPGRFDRQILIDSPDKPAREEIFLVHLKPLKLAPGLEPSQFVHKLANLTPGFSGADIANICNEAALIAARNDEAAVRFEHFEMAIDRVVGGLEKKSRVLAPDEKRRVAIHESGHAVAGWFLEHTDPLLKVSVVPRGVAALGFAQYLPEQRFLESQEQLLDRMAMALGGRAAEQLVLGSISTGAADDLQRVTRLAYSQIVNYGMNPRVGPLAFRELRTGEARYGRPYSDATAELVDAEVRQMVALAYERVTRVLRERRDGLLQLAELLVQQEVVRHDDLKRIFGARPHARASEIDTATFETPEEKQRRLAAQAAPADSPKA